MLAGEPLRRKKAGVRGRERVPYLHDAPGSPARASRGKRAYGKVPRNRGKNQTLIASITLEGGMGEAASIEGATDAEVFETYDDVEEFLAPTLEAGQEVVVLDGLGAHRTVRVRDLIERRGAELLFLPSYSPDLTTPLRKRSPR